jgi:hypothetical protein
MELHPRRLETCEDFLLGSRCGELNPIRHEHAASDGGWIDRSQHHLGDTVGVEQARARECLRMLQDAVRQGVEHRWGAGEDQVSVACELEICSGLVQAAVERETVLLERDCARADPTVVISAESCHKTGTCRCCAAQRFTGSMTMTSRAPNSTRCNAAGAPMTQMGPGC